MKAEGSIYNLFSVGSTYFFGYDHHQSNVPEDWKIKWDEAMFFVLSDGNYSAGAFLRQGEKLGFLMQDTGDGYGIMYYSAQIKPLFKYDEIRIISSEYYSTDFVGYLACRYDEKWDVYRIAEYGGALSRPDPLCRPLTELPCDSFEEAQKIAAQDPFYAKLISEFHGVWRDCMTKAPGMIREDKPHYIRKWFTPLNIDHLKKDQVFVFGSNLKGIHGDGAAKVANNLFGAKWGVGVGPTGRCYAIPTMHGDVEAIRPYVDEFITYAAAHPEQEFLVTRIGCGIARFKPEQIAPLFAEAFRYGNIVLPKDFVEVIESETNVAEDEVTAATTDGDDSKAKQPKRSTTLRVTLPDGTVIQEKEAKDTLIKAIMWAGVDKVKDLGMILNKLPFISETKHVLYDGRQEPHLIPGTNLYIITQLNNETKKTKLNQIGKKLGINWKVEVL